jgi:hypothetical protein
MSYRIMFCHPTGLQGSRPAAPPLLEPCFVGTSVPPTPKWCVPDGGSTCRIQWLIVDLEVEKDDGLDRGRFLF